MFKVLLTGLPRDNTTVAVWEGWFTAREVKRNIAAWLTEYEEVRITPAQLGVLSVKVADYYGDQQD